MQKNEIIEPLGTRLLVRFLQEDDVNTLSSGLVVPNLKSNKKYHRGVVEALGNKEEMMTSLQIGDVIIFGEYGGYEIVLNGSQFVIIEEDDILARVRTQK